MKKKSLTCSLPSSQNNLFETPQDPPGKFIFIYRVSLVKDKSVSFEKCTLSNKEDMSIYETSEFWDEHDISEFNDFEEAKNLKFLLIKKKYAGLDVGTYDKIRRKAKKLKMPEDVLINDWLRERVEA